MITLWLEKGDRPAGLYVAENAAEATRVAREWENQCWRSGLHGRASVVPPAVGAGA